MVPLLIIGGASAVLVFLLRPLDHVSTPKIYFATLSCAVLELAMHTNTYLSTVNPGVLWDLIISGFIWAGLLALISTTLSSLAVVVGILRNLKLAFQGLLLVVASGSGGAEPKMALFLFVWALINLTLFSLLFLKSRTRGLTD